MDVTLHIPDDIVARQQAQGNVSRDILESAALLAYQKRLIGESRLQQWLGFETRLDLHRFLQEHGVSRHYTLADLAHDRHTHDRLGV